MPAFKENNTVGERIFKIDKRKSSKSHASKDISFPIHILRSLFLRLSQLRRKFRNRRRKKKNKTRNPDSNHFRHTQGMERRKEEMLSTVEVEPIKLKFVPIKQAKYIDREYQVLHVI